MLDTMRSVEACQPRVGGANPPVGEEGERRGVLVSSIVLAVSWRTGKGRVLSVNSRDRLAREMTLALFAAAQRLAREWAAAHPREP